MNKNTKTLLWVAGLGAVAYYFWNKNKQARQATKVATLPSTANAQFTGNQGVFDYQNADGDTTRQKADTTISGSSPWKHVVLKGNKPKN